MLRRIAVIIAAATILSCGPLAAQAPESGKRAPGSLGGSIRVAPGGQSRPAGPAPTVQRAPNVQPPPAVSPERAEQAVKDSIRSLDLQTALVTQEADKPKPRPVRISPIKVPQEVFWLMLIIAVAVLFFSLREELMNLIRPAKAGWEPPPPGEGEVKVGSENDALAAADRLGREGNFVEAMHVLLLHSLAEIRRQLGEQFADSLTSREIVRAARITAAARTALRDIVAAVERTYFGAYPAKADDYAACRQNFATLQQALRAGAPA